MVYILLAEGFEETEAVAPYDMLKRAGVETYFAGVGGDLIKSSHGVMIKCETTVEAIDPENADMIVCPGGLVGVDNLLKSEEAMNAVKKAYEAGKIAAAICAGPTVLADLGILQGKNAVCYPGMESRMTGGVMSQEFSTVRDGNVITGRGPGAAIDFGLRLVEELCGKEKADEVCAAIHYERR